MQFSGASTGTLRVVGRQSAANSTRQIHRRRWLTPSKGLVEIGFGWLAALGDFGAVVLAAAASNVVYKLVTFGMLPGVEPVTRVGALIGALVVISNIQRKEYSIRQFETFSGHFGRCVSVWNLAFFCVLALGFATKTTDVFSRGATGVLYVVGLVALGGMHAVMARLAEATKQWASCRRAG